MARSVIPKRYILTAMLASAMVIAALSHDWNGGSERASDKQGDEYVLREQPRRPARGSIAHSHVVEDSTFGRLLLKMLPRWHDWNPAAGIHAPRLWGGEWKPQRILTCNVPGNDQALSGSEMLDVFLREAHYRNRFPTQHPYFLPSAFGWTTRRGFDRYEEVHQDDFLAMAGEIGLPTATSFDWHGRTFQLRDLFPASFFWFDETRELEFSAMAYAAYLEPGSKWCNRFGERFGFDDLCDILVRRDLIQVACHGTHLPYSICTLLAADRETPLLSPHMRERARSRLREFSDALERTQLPAGCWPVRWMGSHLDSRGPHSNLDYIRCTGHHLEWLMIAPDDVVPDCSVIEKAISYLLQAEVAIDTNTLASDKFYNPWSHAARALVLAKGKRFASEVFDGEKQSRTAPGATGGRP